MIPQMIPQIPQILVKREKLMLDQVGNYEHFFHA
jgi:hypothetical protein